MRRQPTGRNPLETPGFSQPAPDARRQRRPPPRSPVAPARRCAYGSARAPVVLVVELDQKGVDLLGELGVLLQLELLLDEVVVRLRLLERCLPVLTDHHKGRQ